MQRPEIARETSHYFRIICPDQQIVNCSLDTSPLRTRQISERAPERGLERVVKLLKKRPPGKDILRKFTNKYKAGSHG